MIVEVMQKRVYGIINFYPVNDLAKKMADLAGTKTLTSHSLKIIKSMEGMEIKIIHEEVNI